MPQFKTPEDFQHLISHSYVATEYKPEILTQIADCLADP